MPHQVLHVVIKQRHILNKPKPHTYVCGNVFMHASLEQVCCHANHLSLPKCHSGHSNSLLRSATETIFCLQSLQQLTQVLLQLHLLSASYVHDPLHGHAQLQAWYSDQEVLLLCTLVLGSLALGTAQVILLLQLACTADKQQISAQQRYVHRWEL